MVDISARVRVLEGCSEGEEMTEDELRKRISVISSTPLPELHSAGWEVLLGPQLTRRPGQTMLHTALIFRVHHSMGDGPALCHILLSAVADPQCQNDEQPDLYAALAKASLDKSRYDDITHFPLFLIYY